jgi:branched-chain amino acid transport system substrate-binding protein
VKKVLIALVIAAVGAVIVATTASGRPGGATKASVLPSSSCGPVFYKGSGSPQLLIASDLPLQGAGRAQPLSMVKAIQYVLEVQYKFKAGKFTVGYQSCDDSTAQQGGWESAKCTSNARAYASDPKVVGVLGTFNSGCAKLVVPILNRAPNGPLTMVSAANTGVGLTHTAPWTDPGEPKVYYPTGKRNYARVATTDDYQGPYAADLLKRLAKKSVFVLHDNQTFGKGVANAFQLRAKKLGLKVLGFEAWDAKATSYEAIGERIKSAGADSVYLGGIVCNNGVKLLKDLRAVVGSGPTFVGPDGWSPFSATLAAGPAAQGMLVSIAGPPASKLGPTGQKFLTDFKAYQKKSTVDPYAIYAAQTAQVLLGAVERSDGTRASVNAQVFKTNVKDGIMGSFRFDANGNISSKAISFYELKGKDGVFKDLVAPGL